MQPFERHYLNYTRFILWFTFGVILAGGIVRTTQSGMGCPDWPTCFGLWIPPTDESQLPPDFEKYLSQQDIDHSFNAFHTWVEYINRLLGALLGVFVFFHFIWTVSKFFRQRKNICWLALFLLLGIGFQGWLGKEVVAANLAVVKVTIHMLMALVLLILPMLIIHQLKQEHRVPDLKLQSLVIITLLSIVVQIIIGTTVREQIDEISKSLEYGKRELWVNALNNLFDVHRFTAGIVAILCIVIFFRSQNHAETKGAGILVFITVLCTIIFGLILQYFNFPAYAQPLHLLLSCGLFASVFNIWIKLKKNILKTPFNFVQKPAI